MKRQYYRQKSIPEKSECTGEKQPYYLRMCIEHEKITPCNALPVLSSLRILFITAMYKKIFYFGTVFS